MHGFALCALKVNHTIEQATFTKKDTFYFSKTSLTACSLAPIYLDNNSGPFMEISLRPHCLAAAAANSVFPVPGNPYNNKPDCRRNGAFSNNLGN